MLEKEKVIEECLYCHGQMERGNQCPVCGDTKLAESIRPDSPPPPIMFNPAPTFDPRIPGV